MNPVVDPAPSAVQDQAVDLPFDQARELAADTASRRLRDFAELAAEWFWEMDASLRFSFLSDRVVASTGVPVASLANRTLGELPELASDIDLPSILRRREPFDDVAFTWTPPGGKPVHLSATGRPRFDTSGTFAGYRGIGRNVTEERRRLRSVSANEDKLRVLVEALPVGIAYVDTELTYRLANGTYRLWFGRPGESLRGRSVGSVLGDEAWSDAQPSFHWALQGQTILFEENGRGEDGRVLDLQTTLLPHVDEAGAVQGLFVLGHDIGEQKRRGDTLARSLGHLSATLDGLETALVVLDRDSRIRTENAAWRQMVADLTDGADGSHQRYADVCGALLPARSEANVSMVRAVEAFARDEGEAVRTELCFASADGQRWLRITASAFKEAGERYVLISHEDITERVLLDRRLRDQQNSLGRAARLSSLGELAATMAHELNQPLTAIANYASLAVSVTESAQPPAPDSLAEPLARLLAETRRAAGIVRRLNRSVRRLPNAHEPLDPDALVHEAIARGKARADDSAIALIAEVEEGVAWPSGDRVQIGQVLDNAISNALEALIGGEVRVRSDGIVRIRVHRDLSRRSVVFEVQDNGPGFQELDGDALEPFVTSKAEGLGLGLAICRSIIESHGGRIVCAAAPDGASLQFFLPIGSDA